MSAKDVADRILQDFRTSMADTAVYNFDSDESAQAVLDVMDQPDWLIAERSGFILLLTVISADERRLTI